MRECPLAENIKVPQELCDECEYYMATYQECWYWNFRKGTRIRLPKIKPSKPLVKNDSYPARHQGRVHRFVPPKEHGQYYKETPGAYPEPIERDTGPRFIPHDIPPPSSLITPIANAEMIKHISSFDSTAEVYEEDFFAGAAQNNPHEPIDDFLGNPGYLGPDKYDEYEKEIEDGFAFPESSPFGPTDYYHPSVHDDPFGMPNPFGPHGMGW